jgi:hypothetical protein
VATPSNNTVIWSSTRCAHPHTTTPDGVSAEPRRERSSSVRPSLRSNADIRSLAEGWLIPRQPPPT